MSSKINFEREGNHKMTSNFSKNKKSMTQDFDIYCSSGNFCLLTTSEWFLKSPKTKVCSQVLISKKDICPSVLSCDFTSQEEATSLEHFPAIFDDVFTDVVLTQIRKTSSEVSCTSISNSIKLKDAEESSCGLLNEAEDSLSTSKLNDSDISSQISKTDLSTPSKSSYSSGYATSISAAASEPSSVIDQSNPEFSNEIESQLSIREDDIIVTVNQPDKSKSSNLIKKEPKQIKNNTLRIPQLKCVSPEEEIAFHPEIESLQRNSVVPHSAYSHYVNQMRLKKLQQEAAQLLFSRKLLELERLRGPRWKWFELKNEDFGPENRRNILMVKNAKQLPIIRQRRKDLLKDLLNFQFKNEMKH